MAPRRRRGRGSPGGRPLKAWLLIAAVPLGLLAWGVGVFLAGHVGRDADGSARATEAARQVPKQPPNRTSEDPKVVRIADEYDWDIFDRRLLIGYSENVFLGRVARKAGAEAEHTSIPGDDEDPHTQYAVEVLGVVKATGAKPLSAGERATVDQLGGPGAKTGKEHVAAPFSCGRQTVGAPLEVGEEYLFATRYDADTRRQDVSAPPAGAEPVAAEGGTEGGAEGTRADLLAAYRRAAAGQIDPLDPRADSCPRKDR